MLRLDRRAAEVMRRHGEEGYPREICGLLAGRTGEGTGVRRVLEACPARNLRDGESADRYEIDPADFLRIEAGARKRSLEIVGVYHSHPDHPALPSETDRLMAGEIWQSSESWSYVILEVSLGRAVSWRSFVLRDGVFHEEPAQED